MRPPFPTGTSTATKFFSPNPTQPAARPLLLPGVKWMYFIFFVGLEAPWKNYQKAFWRAWTCIQPQFWSRSMQQLQKSSLLSTATAQLRSWISVPAYPQGKEGKAAAVVMSPFGGSSFQRLQYCYSLMAEFFPTAKGFCLDQAARMGFDLCYVTPALVRSSTSRRTQLPHWGQPWWWPAIPSRQGVSLPALKIAEGFTFGEAS